MRPITTAKYLFLSAFGITVILTACTNGPPRGGPDGRGEQRTSGITGPVARPVALLFAGMDADQDMIITREEANAEIRIAWDTLSGSDKTVTSLKLASWLQRALGSADAQPSNVAFDNNFDGRISRTEFETRLHEEFEALDASNDATLTRAELVFDISSRVGRQTSGSQREARPQGGRGARPGR